jgi:hypothetical protein
MVEDQNNSCVRGNGRIDCREEAERAAREFIYDNPDRSKEILEYFAEHAKYNIPCAAIYRDRKSISINTAPEEYRPYMMAEDRSNKGTCGGNGKLDWDETGSFVGEFMLENYEQRYGLLRYLNRETGLSRAEVDVSKINRRFRILLNPNLLRLSLSLVDARIISDEERFVPPHEDDLDNNAGARTRPIELGSVDFWMAYAPSLQLTLDFFQYATLGCQYSLYFDLLQHTQKYDSPEDAYTFVGAGGGTAYSFTLGIYAYRELRKRFDLRESFLDIQGIKINETGDGWERAILVEAGVVMHKRQWVRGWDRFSALEEMDEKPHYFRGFTGGVSAQLMSGNDCAGACFGGGYKAGISVDYYHPKMFSVNINLIGFNLGMNL